MQRSEPTKAVRVGILGAGNVGGALARLLLEDGPGIAERSGVTLQLTQVAVADSAKPRPGIPAELLTTDAAGLVASAEVDVVVELIGGVDVARGLVEGALAAKKPVVTANKALLAAHGAELARSAAGSGVDLLYEASAAGAIPVIRVVRESLAGERVRRLMGIVNGTTNYILSKMADEGVGYDEALADAQRLGYAERDSTADVGGHDAAAKAAILAGLAFRCDVEDTDVHREGIGGISALDVAFARRLGYVVKLLAIAERTGPGEEAGVAPARGDAAEISVRVHPAMIPRAHPLASVRGAFNAVFVEGESCGELMFYGQGAGGLPTASAVLGDVIDAAHNLLGGTASPEPARSRLPIRPIDDVRSAFYLSLEVLDRPGALAEVATVFGGHGVSVRSMEQRGLGDEARLVFLTHQAREGDVRATIAALGELEVVKHVGGFIRVAGDPDDGSEELDETGSAR